MWYNIIKIDHPADCVKLQEAFLARGYYIDIPTAQNLWRNYSTETHCAHWLSGSTDPDAVDKLFEYVIAQNLRYRKIFNIGEVDY